MEPKVISGGISVDDRGCVCFVNAFDFKGVKRFYQIRNHFRGYIRAWHGHRKEEKYVFVVRGSILLGVVEIDDDKNVFRFILSDKKPQILYIPSGYYNGFKTLEENTIVIFFSTSTLEESKDDDIRMPWDRWNIWETENR